MDASHSPHTIVAIGSYAASVLATFWRNESMRHQLAADGFTCWKIIEASWEDLMLNKELCQAQLEGACFDISTDGCIGEIPVGAHVMVGLGGSHSARLANAADTGLLSSCAIYATLPFPFDVAREQALHEIQRLQTWQSRLPAGHAMLNQVDRADYVVQKISMLDAMRQVQEQLARLLLQAHQR